MSDIVMMVATRRSLMKVMAIASAKSPLTPEQLKQYMPDEVPATLTQADYLWIVSCLRDNHSP